MKRRGKKRAIIAIARMMLTAIFAMLQSGEVFNPCDLHKFDMPDELRRKQTLSSAKDAVKLLVSLGLVATELSYDEFLLADQYGSTYKKLSVYDRIALAIAKKRSITLLTGDAALRKAAQKENVKIIGTLGILDELLASKLIAESDYKYCLEELDRYNGGVIRLPKDEITKRIQQIESI